LLVVGKIFEHELNILLIRAFFYFFSSHKLPTLPLDIYQMSFFIRSPNIFGLKPNCRA